MTRINVVPVSELCDQHLLAEHRELTRIPNSLLSGKLSADGNRPSDYTLGKGHVKFFTNKIGWLFFRYMALSNECRKRGFNIQEKFPTTKAFGNGFWVDYTPTKAALAMNRGRIMERWPKHARYYGKPYN